MSLSIVRDESVEPFRTNDELIEAMYDEAQSLIAYAGRRRQLERKYHFVKSPLEIDDQDDIEGDQDKCEYLEQVYYKKRQANADRLSLSDANTLPWLNLIESQGLNDFEQQVLWLLFFKAVAPDFRQFCTDWELDRYGSENGKEMCVGNVLQILCPGPSLIQMNKRQHFSADAPLVAHHLVKLDTSAGGSPSILEAEISLTPRVVAWISGDTLSYTSDSPFSVERPADPMDQVVLPPEQLNRILDLVTNYDAYQERRNELGMNQTLTYGHGLVILEYGPPGTGKTLLARALANYTNRPLISLRHGENWPWIDSDEELQALFREARLQKGIVFIDECESLCSRDSSELPTLLVELERAECIVLMATNRPQELAPELDRRFTLKMPFALPDDKERRKIWDVHLGRVPLDADVDLKQLADAYPLAGGYIKNAVLAAINLALARAGDGELTIGMQDLEQGVRFQEKHVGRISRCRAISQPNLKRDQAFLGTQAHAQIEYMVQMVQNAPQVLRKYNLPEAPIKGCKIFLHSPCRLTGLQAVESWASELGKTLETIDMRYLFRGDGDDEEYCDPKEVFAAASGTGHLVAFIDSRYGQASDGEPTKEMLAFFRELAAFEGTALILTDKVKLKHAKPNPFHVHLNLEMPDETVRYTYWRTVLGVDLEDEATAHWEHLAADNPLTLEQIQGVVHRVGLMQAGGGSNSFDRALFEQAISLEGSTSQNQWLFDSNRKAQPDREIKQLGL